MTIESRNEQIGLPKTKRRGELGFTLAEIITVTAIIGVFATLAVASYRSLETRTSFEGAYRAMFNAFQEARATAVVEGKTITCRLYENGVACFHWVDSATNPGQVDWVDTNNDGIPQDGEGEIASVRQLVRFDKDKALDVSPATTYHLSTLNGTPSSFSFRSDGSLISTQPAANGLPQPVVVIASLEHAQDSNVTPLRLSIHQTGLIEVLP